MFEYSYRVSNFTSGLNLATLKKDIAASSIRMPIFEFKDHVILRTPKPARQSGHTELTTVLQHPHSASTGR